MPWWWLINVYSSTVPAAAWSLFVGRVAVLRCEGQGDSEPLQQRKLHSRCQTASC